MQRSRHDIWVGLFVLLGAAAIVFLALKSANLLTLSFESSYTISARFDNIGGLKPGAAVKSAGVKVGTVSRIDLDGQSYRANVVLALSKQYQFPKDSSFKVLTSGLLGEQYIGIDAGFEDDNLAPNAVVTRTQSAVVLENLISQFLFSKAADEGSAKSSGSGKP
jgi:phospholipid/cholesterol/gamma-HCH transport system substrate-binding protein